VRPLKSPSHSVFVRPRFVGVRRPGNQLALRSPEQRTMRHHDEQLQADLSCGKCGVCQVLTESGCGNTGRTLVCCQGCCAFVMGRCPEFDSRSGLHVSGHAEQHAASVFPLCCKAFRCLSSRSTDVTARSRHPSQFPTIYRYSSRFVGRAWDSGRNSRFGRSSNPGRFAGSCVQLAVEAEALAILVEDHGINV
jgi:hypothetical protein